MPDLWLFPDDADQVRRAEVNAAIDNMIGVVQAAVPKMVEVANLDGARRHAAAGFLRRAIELLDAARRADNGSSTAPVVELAARSIFELTCRARYLLLCDKAEDEFIRMCHDHVVREGKLGRATANPTPGLPSFLASAIAGTDPKEPRDLWTICESLDEKEKRDEDDVYSARASYNLIYRWFSNSAAHAGLSATKRFAKQEDGILLMIPSPEPLTTHWPVPVVAAFVGELARTVFESLDLPVDKLLATEVALPTRPDASND